MNWIKAMFIGVIVIDNISFVKWRTPLSFVTRVLVVARALDFFPLWTRSLARSLSVRDSIKLGFFQELIQFLLIFRIVLTTPICSRILLRYILFVVFGEIIQITEQLTRRINRSLSLLSVLAVSSSLFVLVLRAVNLYVYFPHKNAMQTLFKRPNHFIYKAKSQR